MDAGENKSASSPCPGDEEAPYASSNAMLVSLVEQAGRCIAANEQGRDIVDAFHSFIDMYNNNQAFDQIVNSQAISKLCGRLHAANANNERVATPHITVVLGPAAALKYQRAEVVAREIGGHVLDTDGSRNEIIRLLLPLAKITDRGPEQYSKWSLHLPRVSEREKKERMLDMLPKLINKRSAKLYHDESRPIVKTAQSLRPVHELFEYSENGRLICIHLMDGSFEPCNGVGDRPNGASCTMIRVWDSFTEHVEGYLIAGIEILVEFYKRSQDGYELIKTVKMATNTTLEDLQELNQYRN